MLGILENGLGKTKENNRRILQEVYIVAMLYLISCIYGE